MEKGFEILWTDLALEELSETVGYLKREFSQKEIPDRICRETFPQEWRAHQRAAGQGGRRSPSR